MTGQAQAPSFRPLSNRRQTRRPAQRALGTALLGLTLLVTSMAWASGTLASTTGPALSTKIVAACDGVSLRTKAAVSSTRKTVARSGTTVTVAATVTGGTYSAACAGRSVSGNSWYRISAINGKSVSSLYGVSYVYGASKLFRKVTVATTITTACDGVNLRTSASTGGAVKRKLSAAATVVAVARVTGGSYTTDCAGRSASGNTWFRISRIGSQTVSSLYGVSYLYAATSLFTTVAAAPAPTPTPSPTPTPAPSSPAAIFEIGASVTFHGRGWGHGVGLSQYGARGRALAGRSYADILGHYYRGATLGTVANSQIRVLVLDDFRATAAAPLVLSGRGADWTIDGIGTAFPADARVTFSPPTTGTTTWRRLVTSSLGAVLHDSRGPGEMRIRPSISATRIQVDSKPGTYDRYRGVVRVLASGTTVDVVNELPLETYLRGAVPAEMPAGWPAEALKAQSVAARSYAARRLRPGVSHWDVYDDTRTQVYGGSLREHSATNAAISATAGRVVMSGSSIANTVYHSTGGGATEHNENVFVSTTGARTASPVTYLRGSADRSADGTPYDAASPYATWKTATYSQAQLSTWFASDSRTNVGTLAKLDLRNRGVSGRLISVTLIGATGTTKTVSGDVFRSVFNVRKPSADPLFRSNLFGLASLP